MPFLLIGLAIFFPRVVIVALYLLTDWFSASFDGIILPLIGFIFAPVTLFWYAIVQTYFGGAWSTVPLVGIIVAVIIDFGLVSRSRR
ncbi:hypothetical protein CEQ90_07130 [Lewinellaceae bacterium SD302]|nr:hypothetical protein CEQ90_07130 [Lewinellaceae bacterium SD302]